MCGRFVQIIDADLIKQEFNLTTVPDTSARYNVAPTQQAHVITNDNPTTLTALRWGLIPSWSKDAAIGSKLINARSETIEDKPSFRSAFRKRRCIVPVNGFYEWKIEDGAKQPYYIYPHNGGVLALGGLWETWTNPASGEILTTFTIITTEANAFMRAFHERMPLILSRSDYDAWLRSDDLLVLRGLLKSAGDDILDAHPVTRAVNRPTYDAPDCIMPLTE